MKKEMKSPINPMFNQYISKYSPTNFETAWYFGHDLDMFLFITGYGQ